MLTVLGFGGRWIGLAYAGGFLSVLWVFCFVATPTGAQSLTEPVWGPSVLFRHLRLVRNAASVLTAAAGLILGLPAVAG